MPNHRRTVVARRTTEIGISGEFVTEGQIGTLITTRKLPEDPERMALVKWRGRPGHASHPLSDIEVL